MSKNNQMKTCIGILAILGLLADSACSTPCGTLEGNIKVSNSIDVENLACYEVVTGFVDINTVDGPANIELPFLHEVWGNLNVLYNYNMSMISLPSLTKVSGNFAFINNPQLADLQGFQMLEEIGGHLEISSATDGPLAAHKNFNLTNFDGMDSLKKVGGNILIEDNPAFADCEAERFVAGIDEVGGEVTIQNNTGTASCD